MTQLITKIIAPSFAFKDIDGTYPQIKQLSGALTAGTANQQVIAAVTGKRLRILSMIGSCESAGGSFIHLRSGTGGTILCCIFIPGSTNVILDLNELGWCDTAAGVGLFADTGTDAPIISVRYVEYTQAA